MTNTAHLSTQRKRILFIFFSPPFRSRSTFDNCLLSNVYGLSLDTILETSFGWDVWTYGGVIFPNADSTALSGLQLNKKGTILGYNFRYNDLFSQGLL